MLLMMIPFGIALMRRARWPQTPLLVSVVVNIEGLCDPAALKTLPEARSALGLDDLSDLSCELVNELSPPMDDVLQASLERTVKLARGKASVGKSCVKETDDGHARVIKTAIQLVGTVLLAQRLVSFVR